MSVIHLHHIQVTLERMFEGKIDLSDYARKPPAEKKKAFLTRALAAYTIHYWARTDVDTAAKAVVDGFDDNGIDAIYYEQAHNTLWIVQTKWIQAGTGIPSLGDIKKFTGGVRDLINCKWDRFNDKLRAKIPDVQRALDDAKTHHGFVVAYPGDPLSSHPARELEDMVDELNKPTGVAQTYPFSLAEIHDAVAGLTRDEGVEFDLTLLEWGMKAEPIKAFYGQANAVDLAQQFQKYGQRLDTKNIRHFLGDTSINEDIQATLRNRPEDFWYFNNGVTILCKSVEKKPMGGNNRDFGIFECKGAHIVNGAQTVGNIGKLPAHARAALEKAKVMVRLISLVNCPEGYADELTRATNTQNKVERRDFVSLDRQQERLWTELHIEGVQYAYKTGDSPVLLNERCNLEEATAALACSSRDLQYAIWSKKEIGKLWEDIEHPPYTDLFNSQLNGTKLWRLVQILRSVDKALRVNERSGDERHIAVNGNRLVAFLVFNNIRMRLIEDPGVEMTTILHHTAVLTERVLTELATAVKEIFPDAMVGRLFYNVTKCRTLAQLIQQRLDLQPPQTSEAVG